MRVETKYGTQRGQLDSWVGKGEVLTDGDSAHVVNRGSRVGVDDVPAKTEDHGGDTESAVLGNLPWIRLSLELGYPITYAEATRSSAEKIETYDKLYNKKISDDIETRRGTGSVTYNTESLKLKMRNMHIGLDLNLIQEAQIALKEERPYQDGMISAKCGKNMPKYKIGADLWGNIVTSGLGGIFSLGLYLTAKNLKLNNPNIYAANLYEGQGLTTLAGLRDNPYNLLRAMQDVESRNRYAINQSGGLTGALKYLANIAGGIGLQKNYADVLYRSNEQNNKYKAAWASAALQAGQANAQRMLAANQYRDEAYARSHAARQQMMQMGMQNMLGQVQQYYANEFKRRQFDRMMDLYWAEKGGQPKTYSQKQIKNMVGFSVPQYNENDPLMIAPKGTPRIYSPNYLWDGMTIEERKRLFGV